MAAPLAAGPGPQAAHAPRGPVAPALGSVRKVLRSLTERLFAKRRGSAMADEARCTPLTENGRTLGLLERSNVFICGMAGAHP